MTSVIAVSGEAAHRSRMVPATNSGLGTREAIEEHQQLQALLRQSRTYRLQDIGSPPLGRALVQFILRFLSCRLTETNAGTATVFIDEFDAGLPEHSLNFLK